MISMFSWKKNNNYFVVIFLSVHFLFTGTVFCQHTSEELFHELIDHEKKSALQFHGKIESTASVSSFDVIAERCEWTLDPQVRYISGKVTTCFRPLQSSMNQIELDLSYALIVDSVIYHGSPISFQHSAADELLISFPIPLSAQVIDSVSIVYHGVPGLSGFGSFEIDQHATGPILWTLSEPYGSKEWWPCHQDLNDKIDTLDVFVTTASMYKVAGNGLLMSEIISGNSKVSHWHSEYPVAAYLVGVAVTNYSTFADTIVLSDGTSMPVVQYTYPQDSARTRSKLAEQHFNEVILFFDSLFGKYPFSKEKYGQAQFGWGGGMEHQTMSFIGNFDAYLLIHELAHQWFGDKITCGSWEDIWLNEGFATYLQGLGRQRIVPSTWNSFLTGISNTITTKPDGSVFCDDTTDVSRIFDYRLTYCKGAYLLHMLRWVMGDSTFFTSIRNYISDANLVYSYARTSNLKTHLELGSGLNLTYFFNQWYTGQGYPSYQLEWNQNGSTVELIIEQTQSDASVSFFQMPVSIQFSGNGRDTILVFDHQYSRQRFTCTLDFEVKNIYFDPERWILSAENSVISTRLKNASHYSSLVFPNPTNGILTVYDNTLPIHSIRVFDETGRMVKKVDFEFPANQQEVDISTLPAAYYLLEIETMKTVSTLKLIKIRE